MNKERIWNLFFIIGIFALDRLTKIAIINSTDLYGEKIFTITSFLNLNLIWNDGIAFGMLSFQEKNYYNFLTGIIILITIIIFWMITKTKKIEKVAFMMIFGGSIGNIFDRLYYSSVPDFIDFHINNFHWFIFNIADIFISIGVFFMILYEIIDNNSDKNEKY